MNQECIIDSLIEQWKTYAIQKGIKWERSFLQWNLPSGVEADFALRLALPIAFKTKSPVQEVAQQIISLSKHNKFLQGKITPGGYINFRLSDEYYYKFIKKITAKRKNPRIKKTVLIEHTSANPTGQLHLGHARIAIIGDTLANIYQFLGFQTVREYYINDRGQQINSLVNSVWYYYCLLYNFFPVESTNLEYQTSTVKNIARFLSKKYSNSLLKNQLDSESFTILRQESLDFLLNKIKKDLKNCRIIFDNWISETELCKNDNLTQLVQTLSSKNLTYFQEEALFLKSSQVGDNKDRVIIKKNGDYTYLLPDTLYHLNKLFRADVLINVFGADHHGHISGVKAALQLHSGCNSVSRIKVVLVQMLSLLTAEGKSQKFSKRLGTAINLDEALKWWGKDWLRFTLLSKSPDTHLEIKEEMFRADQKNQLYYLQYAYARCCQLLNKARERGVNLNSEKCRTLAWNEAEKNVLRGLLRFSFVLQTIVEENEPHYLIHYLTDLAQNFQAYYQKGEIIIDESKPLKTKQRILLVQGVKKVLKIGLNLAGITAPNRM